MRVSSKSAIRAFVQGRTNDRDIAARDLNAWYKLAEDVGWANFGEMKETFGSADIVGRCVVFDVGNNRFRLIARVFCASQKMYILKVMDHREYDKKQWVKECECYDPKPPQKPEKKSPARRKPRRR